MASSVRTQEFAFLVNVMAAACTLQDRPLTSREACDAAAATCNLGLENWPRQWLAASDDASGSGVGPTTLPDDSLVAQDLITVFQVGWRVLRQHVSLYAAARLLDTLTALRSTDREIQFGLLRLRNELTTHWRAGTPWRAGRTLDVLAMLDMPAWAALLGLIGELPVLLANVVGAGAPARARWIRRRSSSSRTTARSAAYASSCARCPVCPSADRRLLGPASACSPERPMARRGRTPATACSRDRQRARASRRWHRR